jgi:hypothetical protein
MSRAFCWLIAIPMPASATIRRQRPQRHPEAAAQLAVPDAYHHRGHRHQGVNDHDHHTGEGDQVVEGTEDAQQAVAHEQHGEAVHRYLATAAQVGEESVERARPQPVPAGGEVDPGVPEIGAQARVEHRDDHTDEQDRGARRAHHLMRQRRQRRV